MGKNAHPPRGSKNPKIPVEQSTASGAGNDTGTNTSKGNRKKGKTVEDNAHANGAQEVKKPDTRTLIGGASWTGKLPVNMLSEHCQKQKWEKPEYTMHKSPEGYSSMVILRSKNTKTQEMTVLPSFKLPPDYKHLAFQPTAVEARHFAAAYALFRICSMRNIHMMMPPKYRDLWKGEFQQMKAEDEKVNMAWKYDADPFFTHVEREKAQQKKQVAAEAAETTKSQQQYTPGMTTGSNRVSMKGWSTAAKVEMGIKMRGEIEKLVRSHSIWNPLLVNMSSEKQNETIHNLSDRGFRRGHIEEAIKICKDQEEVLEWLLIHVPEDDLPKWCLPEGYIAGVSLATTDLKQDAAVKRLATGGYSAETCRSFYEYYNGDERRAAQALQNDLLSIEDTINNEVNGLKANGPDVWAEEQEILASIYEQKYRSFGILSCRIGIEVSNIEGAACYFTQPYGPYPEIPPILTIDAKLPSHIRLSITRQALEYAVENLIGEQMIFSLVDWLEREIPSIIASPGPLTKIVNAGNEIPSRHDQVSQGSETGPKKRQINSAANQNLGAGANKQILSAWQIRQQTTQQQKMLQSRQTLPAWQLRETIVKAINEFQIVIVSGETGSGKSTQTVQFILDEMIQKGQGENANIICTQPRRISAMSLAERVSQERCSTVGEEVGYAIRGESRQSRDITKIMFMTTGVLLRRLQMAGESMKEIMDSLADVSHIIVDEIHERSLDTDFLLALMRDALKQRKDLKLVLMSATLDATAFEAYFGGPATVTRVEIEGRTYPVTDLYIDDVVRTTGFGLNNWDDGDEDNISQRLQRLGMGINYDMIAALVQQIDEDLGTDPGGILIFLPGTAEIQRILNKLQDLPDIYALPLHASLLPSEQRRVFPPAPVGKRKVIASTNVAETSITIDDIVAVIDTGRVKETRYDPQSSMVKLEELWASRAACKQRRGRAGRVRSGMCYKLFTQNVEKKMSERPDPEIRRVPLEQLCLAVKAMGVQDVVNFLANTLTPPEQKAIEGALELLHGIGALDGNRLTSLGQHLSMIPADLRCAKLMVYGALFDYLEECVLIASILSVKSPFVNPQDKRDEAKAARSSFSCGQGDVIADLHAYQRWTELRDLKTAKQIRSWCQENFLSHNILCDISSNRSQYLTTLKEIGFIPLDYRSPAKRTEVSYPFLNALILSALHPQILRISFPAQKYQPTVSGALPVDPESREIKFFDSAHERAFLHPSSTLFSTQSFPNNSTFLSYYRKVETSKVFANDLTPSGSFGLMLFGGPIELDTYGRGILVDGWIKLRGWPRIGMLISRLRVILDRILTNWIDKPGFGSRGKMEQSLVNVVKKLIELGGMDA